jgi:hypothetical protein
MSVWFREFQDSNDCEIGVLSNSANYSVMETGDFVYVYNGKNNFAVMGWTKTPEEADWIYIGEFD